MLGSAHVGGYEEPLVLGEDLRSPVAIEGIGGIYKAIGDRTAAGQEERAGLVLAIACFDSRAGGKPITGATFNCPGVPANRVSNHETFICISVQVLAICKEVVWTEVFNKALGTDGFDAQVHVRQEG